MEIAIQKLTNLCILAGVFWILLFSLPQISMDMRMMDGNANCLFGSHSVAICQMSPMEHIQEWQGIFTILPTQYMPFHFVIFALLVISKLKLWNRFLIPEVPLVILGSRYSLVSFQIFDSLEELFSSGILNPKVFSV